MEETYRGYSQHCYFRATRQRCFWSWLNKSKQCWPPSRGSPGITQLVDKLLLCSALFKIKRAVFDGYIESGSMTKELSFCTRFQVELLEANIATLSLRHTWLICACWLGFPFSWSADIHLTWPAVADELQVGIRLKRHNVAETLLWEDGKW